jgi:hypothetical protein
MTPAVNVVLRDSVIVERISTQPESRSLFRTTVPNMQDIYTATGGSSMREYRVLVHAALHRPHFRKTWRSLSDGIFKLLTIYPYLETSMTEIRSLSVIFHALDHFTLQGKCESTS